jgi:hypothetical protein
VLKGSNLQRGCCINRGCAHGILAWDESGFLGEWDFVAPDSFLKSGKDIAQHSKIANEFRGWKGLGSVMAMSVVIMSTGDPIFSVAKLLDDGCQDGFVAKGLVLCINE